LGERGFDAQAGVDEANSAEAMRLHRGDAHAEALQSGDTIGHKALAAGLVDGRTATVGDRYFQAALAGGQGGRDSGWTSADYENICRFKQTAVVQHLSAANFCTGWSQKLLFAHGFLEHCLVRRSKY
jgi:hypothetical protein